MTLMNLIVMKFLNSKSNSVATRPLEICRHDAPFPIRRLLLLAAFQILFKGVVRSSHKHRILSRSTWPPYPRRFYSQDSAPWFIRGHLVLPAPQRSWCPTPVHIALCQD